MRPGSIKTGICEFTVMPSGLCNSPSTFERLSARYARYIPEWYHHVGQDLGRALATSFFSANFGTYSEYRFPSTKWKAVFGSSNPLPAFRNIWSQVKTMKKQWKVFLINHTCFITIQLYIKLQHWTTQASVIFEKKLRLPFDFVGKPGEHTYQVKIISISLNFEKKFTIRSVPI